jgi:hypothetical protein
MVVNFYLSYWLTVTVYEPGVMNLGTLHEIETGLITLTMRHGTLPINTVTVFLLSNPPPLTVITYPPAAIVFGVVDVTDNSILVIQILSANPLLLTMKV